MNRTVCHWIPRHHSVYNHKISWVFTNVCIFILRVISYVTMHTVCFMRCLSVGPYSLYYHDSKRGDNDIIPSATVTAAILEVHCAATVYRRKHAHSCKLFFVELHASRNAQSANNVGVIIFIFFILTHFLSTGCIPTNMAALFYAQSMTSVHIMYTISVISSRCVLVCCCDWFLVLRYTVSRRANRDVLI